MTPQQLKNSILQLAIQGKLVEQRPEEGTAKELLQEISAEKHRLIQEGKIKKAKPLPEISEDEIPFEVPESWEWVRLGVLCLKLTDGSHNPPPKKECGYPVVSAKCIDNGKINLDLVDRYTDCQGYEKENPRTNIQFGDLILGIIGASIGNVARFCSEAKVIAQRSIAIVKTMVYDEYIFYALKSPYIQEALSKRKTGTAQPGVYLSELNKLPIPLPPLAEQHRIVSKIEELLPYIDQYDKAYTKLNEWNKKFPESIKKSILQYAMEGKLVEQRPEEGTAEELLREIRAEKERLIKEGKIKKTKPLPEISEDEIPFEVPESWKWVRIGEIFYLQAGKSLPSSEIRESKENEYMHPCYGGNGLRGYVSQFNREGFYPLIGRQGALCGNINLATGKFYATEHAVVTETFSGTDIKWAGMFLKALNLNQYATATAQPGLAVKNLNSVLIPLPPVKEQKRIVDRVEELFCIICNERALR